MSSEHCVLCGLIVSYDCHTIIRDQTSCKCINNPVMMKYVALEKLEREKEKKAVKITLKHYVSTLRNRLFAYDSGENEKIITDALANISDRLDKLE